MERKKDRKTEDRKTERQKDRKKNRKTERQKDRKTETQKDRKTLLPVLPPGMIFTDTICSGSSSSSSSSGHRSWILADTSACLAAPGLHNFLATFTSLAPLGLCLCCSHHPRPAGHGWLATACAGHLRQQPSAQPLEQLGVRSRAWSPNAWPAQHSRNTPSVGTAPAAPRLHEVVRCVRATSHCRAACLRGCVCARTACAAAWQAREGM